MKLDILLPAADVSPKQKKMLTDLIVLGELLGQSSMVSRLKELLLHVLGDRKQKWTPEELRNVVKNTTPSSAARRMLLFLPWHQFDHKMKQELGFETTITDPAALIECELSKTMEIQSQGGKKKKRYKQVTLAAVLKKIQEREALRMHLTPSLREVIGEDIRTRVLWEFGRDCGDAAERSLALDLNA